MGEVNAADPYPPGHRYRSCPPLGVSDPLRVDGLCHGSGILRAALVPERGSLMVTVPRVDSSVALVGLSAESRYSCLPRSTRGSDSNGAKNNDLHPDGCSEAGRRGSKWARLNPSSTSKRYLPYGLTPRKVESPHKLLKGRMVPRGVAQNLGVSIPTLYCWVQAESL
jgi:hypothetical protein